MYYYQCLGPSAARAAVASAEASVRGHLTAREFAAVHSAYGSAALYLKGQHFILTLLHDAHHNGARHKASERCRDHGA